jgi:hypothetical protein
MAIFVLQFLYIGLALSQDLVVSSSASVSNPTLPVSRVPSGTSSLSVSTGRS